MCLAIPGKIIKIYEDKTALVDFNGLDKKVSTDLISGLSIDDYVLVHAGFIIEKVDTVEAEKTLILIKELQ